MTISELRSSGSKIFIALRSGVYLVSVWRGPSFGIGCAHDLDAALQQALR